GNEADGLYEDLGVGGKIQLPGRGGGIYGAAGTLTLIRSTVSQNVAASATQGGGGGQGGGIFSVAPVAIVNSTVAANFINSQGLGPPDGGGIYIQAQNTPMLTLDNATIAFNGGEGPGASVVAGGNL